MEEYLSRVYFKDSNSQSCGYYMLEMGKKLGVCLWNHQPSVNTVEHCIGAFILDPGFMSFPYIGKL